MKLRLIVLLAVASLVSAPAFAGHGNPKDFSAVQRMAPKKPADLDSTATVAPNKCTGKACKQH